MTGKDFLFDPPYENFSGLTFNPLSRTYYMTDNQLDAIFEIDRDGGLKRTINISGLKKPGEDNTDAEGITWMYGERFALVMEGGEEMAVLTISSATTAVTRSQSTIFDLSGDPKGIAYKASEDALYWISQTNPKRVIKAHINDRNGKLETVWNKVVDNLPDAGLADVAVFPRLSPNLFLLGQSSQTIMEVDPSGQTAVLKSSFSIAGWPIPRPGALAFDADGSFRIVGKHAAGVPQDDFSVFVPTAAIRNQPPFAYAGSDITATDYFGQGALVNVDGSLSTDTDGAIIDYIWFVNGTIAVTGFGPRVSSLSHTFTDGVSMVTLMVRDDANETSQATIQVTVNRAPASERPPDTFPQPDNFPAVSLNYIHPGSLTQQAEFFFELFETGSGEIHVYDQTGRQVRSFQTPTFPPGQYRAPWDLRNDDGGQIGSGVYFVLIKTPDKTKSEKLVIVR